MHRSVNKAVTKQIDIYGQKLPKKDKKKSAQRLFRIDTGSLKIIFEQKINLKYFIMSQSFKDGSNVITENSKNISNQTYRTQFRSVENALQNEKSKAQCIIQLHKQQQT